VDQRRVSLNNPAFAGRLRQPSRSPAYISRPTTRATTRTIQDVAFKVQPQPSPKPQVPQQTQQVTGPVQDFVVRQKPPKPVQQTAVVSSPKLHHQTERSQVLRRDVAIHQQRLLTAQFEPAPLPPKKESKLRQKRSFFLYAMAAIIFIVGAAVSLNGFRANRQVAAQVEHLSHQSESSSEDNGSHPSTKPPSTTDISGYAVAPNLPRYIDISKLAVHARVLSMGVTSSNQLKAPGNVFDAGWYNASAQPGQPGAMLLDGHISSWQTKGVFYGLNKLQSGDPIVITRGDGKKFTYTVVKTETDDASKVDMSSLLVSQDTAKPGLNLISCSGEVIPGTNEFNKRIVVYAVMD